MNNVYVVVVTYQGKLWYERCFNSLRQSKCPVNTVVVDNNSSDGSVEYIKENFPEVQLLESNINLGFGQGNNLGIKYALDKGADYIFLLNQDTWIDSDTIQELIRISKANVEYGILAPINLDVDKKILYSSYIEFLIDKNSPERYDLFEDMYFQRLRDVYEISYTPASSWFIPKEVFLNIGGFDPLFFHFGEDDNYMQRVKYHGYKIGICPKLTIVHDIFSVKKPTEEMYRTEKKTHIRNLLLELTNVSNTRLFNSYLISYLKRIVKSLISLKFRKVKTTYLDFKYLISNYKKLSYSRSESRKKAIKLWL